ncbi:MAG: hypothetical protein JNL98_05075 [Bryobacterales bacterium]|nr:hypothetical protein [Bryobacterales bacterium]
MARPRKTPILDNSVWAAALEGLEMQKHRLEEQIRQVRAMMGAPRRGRPPASPSSISIPSVESAAPAPSKSGGRRTLSPAARKRIAAAQKKRWEAFRKKKEGSGGE